MSKIADLAKQGVVYRPLSEASAEQAPPKEEQGNFSRGFDKAMLQVPQTLGGAAALAGDIVGADGLKDYGLNLYQKNADKIQAITKDSDSLSNVLEGDASGADWLANSAGYVAGQAIQAVATGGVGGFIGSQLAKRGISGVVARGANSLAARQVASKVASRGATYGAGTALLGSNFVQEAGSIYPEALHTADAEGRTLDGMDKARVVGAAGAAAAVDTAMDALMLGRVLKGARKPGESMLRAGVREIPGAMARETVTEGIQTGIERWGAQQELGTADAIRDYVDSMGVGAVGGGMGGAASVIRANKAVPESGPLTRAANIATEQEILLLENNPQQLIAFPDGTVGDEAAKQAFLSQYSDPEERQRRERELMGRDPETGKRVEPEVQEPPKFADTPEAEAQALADWGAQHEAVPIEQAHALLAAPGMKGESMMIAPHPDGQGFTVVPANWLTLDTQAKVMDLQKPVKAGAKEKADAVPAAAKDGYAGADHVAQPQSGADVAPAQPSVSGAVPAVDGAPASPALSEPEWKSNPYTAYKFADAARAATFMANKGADPALFEVREVDGGKFAIKRRTTPTEGAPHGNDPVLAQDDGAAGRASDEIADPAGRSDAVGTGAAAAQPGERGAAVGESGEAVQPGDVRAAGSADADPALSEKSPVVAVDDALLDVAREETAAADSLIRYDVMEDQQGVMPGKPTKINRELKKGTYSLDDMRAAWSKTRERLRQVHGDSVILYRAEAPSDRWHSDTQVVYMGDEALAKRFAENDRKVEQYTVPLDDVIGLNVQRNGYYEFIVKRQGPAMAEPAQEKPADVPERPQVPEEAPPAPSQEGTQQADAEPAAAADTGSAAAPAGEVAPPAWRDKLIPAMSDAELVEAIEHYGPTHKRTPKLQKALDNRRAKADPDAKKPDWREETAKKEARLAEQLKTANENAAARAAQADDGIPLAFYKKVKVPAEVFVEETGMTKTVDIPADIALKSVREDIANLQALLKCMKGGK